LPLEEELEMEETAPARAKVIGILGILFGLMGMLGAHG
jgi:hypothetical protein